MLKGKFDLMGKTALVTGSTRGIGKAIGDAYFMALELHSVDVPWWGGLVKPWAPTKECDKEWANDRRLS